MWCAGRSQKLSGYLYGVDLARGVNSRRDSLGLDLDGGSSPRYVSHSDEDRR